MRRPRISSISLNRIAALIPSWSLSVEPWILNTGPSFSISGPATTTAGAPLSITVTALDASNNVNPSYTGKVVVSSVTNGIRSLFSYTDRYGNLLSTSTAASTAFASSTTVRVQLYLRPLPSVGEFDIFSTASLRNNR